MDWRSLAQDVDLARSRVEALKVREVPADPARTPAEVAARAFAELDIAFEELSVAQQALREHAEQVLAARRAVTDQDWAYRQLLSTDGAGFLTSTLDGLIVEVNPRVGALLDLEPRFLSRKPLATFVHARERSAFLQRLEDAGRGGRGPHTWTQRFAPSGGCAIECQVHVVRSHTVVSPLLFWRIVEGVESVERARSASDEHWPHTRIQSEVDRQVIDRTNELELRDRRKDEILATISHEMRTPLDVISGYAAMLGAGGLGEESMAKAIAAIERNAALQAKLVAELLDVTRSAAGRLGLTLIVAEADPE